MALIAVDAVVHITPDTGMVRVSLSLSVAVSALEDRVVVRILVAVAARPGVPVRHREPGVIERGPCPGCRCMASLARRGETGGRVGRIGRAIVVRRMAGVAVGRRPGEDVVDVATGAGYVHMGSRQGERRGAVVESGRSERSGVVADRTVCREACSDVIRVRRAVELGLVTADARRRQSGKLPVGVTV